MKERSCGRSTRLAAALIAACLLNPANAASRGHRSRPGEVVALHVISDPITYDAQRKRAMAEYSLRHYGESSWQLTPRVIVLHFTASTSYASTRAMFENDRPHRGEHPGVCAHYVIDGDGSTYELVPPGLRCRHAIGLNHVALGIELVQPYGYGSRWADREILGRRAQMDAALRLVRSLQSRFGIQTEDVIGHAMANGHPAFIDLAGWRNDHTDWLPDDVREFRRRLQPR